MTRSETLVEQVLRDARLIGTRRRDDLAEELRAHLDDLAEDICREGVDDQHALAGEIAERFGDPAVVARQFASIYRRDRMAAAAGAFALLGLASVAVVWGLVYVAQAWAALRLGFVPVTALSVTHLGDEGLLLAGLTLGYLAMFLRGRLTATPRLLMPLLFTSLTALPLVAALALWRPGVAVILGAALACAAVVRGIELSIPPASVRFTGLLGFFWLLGGLAHAGMRAPTAGNAWLTVLPTCAAIALACQCTMSLAGLFDRRVLQRHLA